MTTRFQFYINNYYYDSIYDDEFYGDRAGSYRMLEKVIWNMYQLLKSGDHQLIIINGAEEMLKSMNNCNDYESWVKEEFPSLAAQLNDPVYTKYRHPDSYLKK